MLSPRYPFVMSSVDEIEKAIAKLPRGEFVQLERWFDAERNRKWDQQIEGDAQSGELRKLYERLQSENQEKSNVPLDEFLDKQGIPQRLAHPSNGQGKRMGARI